MINNSNKLKKTVALSLSLAIFAVSGSQSYAKNLKIGELTQEYNSNYSNLKFLENSEKKKVYTFSEEDQNYKYIDNIVDENKVTTSKYIQKDGAYELIDEIEYEITDDYLNIYSESEKREEKIKLDEFKQQLELTEDKDTNDRFSSAVSKSSYNWKLESSLKKSTSVRNMGITAIAMLLSGLVGGPIGAFGGVAAYLFDKQMPIAYYRAYVYKDANGSAARKYRIFYYTDSTYKVSTGEKVEYIRY